MAKSLFVCQICGAEHRKWAGQCPDCREWNSMTEQVIESTIRVGKASKSMATTAIPDIAMHKTERRSTGINELNRVLGGGLLSGFAIIRA
ncbi:MAG: hypothetical protein Q9M15_00180 [Mariprofundaceae bacterium]|nr:hypothetical protein [Mariprofundaceae bacterium]